MAGKNTLEMVAMRCCFENIREGRVGVVEARCRRVHRSLDNSSHFAGTAKTDRILDVQDRCSLRDRLRWDRYSIDMAAVMVNVSLETFYISAE